ncbi:MAG: hypothetical protein HUJ68_06340, partial [Clostridia bacterium]|nr:hypothetical protein [Clostridia bacterium]
LDRENLEKFVDGLCDESKKEYYYIPHVFLKCDKLIIDAASDMFKDFAKQSKYRYYYDVSRPIVGDK